MAALKSRLSDLNSQVLSTKSCSLLCKGNRKTSFCFMGQYSSFPYHLVTSPAVNLNFGSKGDLLGKNSRLVSAVDGVTLERNLVHLSLNVLTYKKTHDPKSLLRLWWWSKVLTKKVFRKISSAVKVRYFGQVLHRRMNREGEQFGHFITHNW